MIDLSKLSPSPWYFTPSTNDNLETFVFNEKDEDVPVLSPILINGDTCDANWDFIVMARQAFDVMMRREWYALPNIWSKKWTVLSSFGVPIIHGNSDSVLFSSADPFSCLVEADEWFTNEESKRSPTD